LETGEFKSRRHGAADQRSVAEALGSLPRVARHHGLGPLAGRKIGAEAQAPTRPLIGLSNFQF
jgi:hypothetical protein